MRAALIATAWLAGICIVGCKRDSQPARGSAGLAAVEAPAVTPVHTDPDLEAGNQALRKQPVDLAGAARHYQSACGRKVGEACAALGNLYQDGRGVAHDDGKAAQLYQRACDLDAGVGCFNLATMYNTGAGIDVDEAKAQSYFDRARDSYQRSCEAGQQQWCMNLGVMYEQGYGVSAEPGRASGLYRSACDAGHGESCVNLALQKLEGRGALRDTQGGRELLDATCTSGTVLACALLAQELLRPAAGNAPAEADIARGLELGQQACRDGDGQACSIMGLEYGLGERVGRSGPRAVELLDRACSLGKMTACRMVAEELKATDMPRAINYLDRACAIGEPEACTLVASYEDSLGAAADQTRISALYRQGCRMGVPDACMALFSRGETPPPLPEDRKRALGRAMCARGVTAACEAVDERVLQ